MTNTQFAAGLRELADIYDAHPEMWVPDRLRIHHGGWDKIEFATTARALAPIRKMSPRDPDDYFFTIEKSLPSGMILELSTARSNVCRKVRRTEMVEVDTWDCSDPILGALDAH